MNAILVLALHVICILFDQSDASVTLPCLRTCIADDQILSCDQIQKVDLVDVLTCIGNHPKAKLVKLTQTKLECDCAFEDFLSSLHGVNIVVFHDVSCTTDVITTCRYGNSPVKDETVSLSYVPLFDDVIDVKKANWRKVFDSHYQRLWSILSGIQDPDVRNLYQKQLLTKSQEAEIRLFKLSAEPEGKEVNGDGQRGMENGISFIANMTNVQEVEEKISAASGKLFKVIVSSCVLGLLFLLVLVFLLCKLEVERRKMGNCPISGDFCLDTKLQMRLNSWRSFLDKFACYKRSKADGGGADKETRPLVTRQVIVDQTPIQSAGTVVPQDSRSSVAVSSLSRLVTQQPEVTESELKPSRSDKQMEDMAGPREKTEGEHVSGGDTSVSSETAQTHNAPVEGTKVLTD